MPRAGTTFHPLEYGYGRACANNLPVQPADDVSGWAAKAGKPTYDQGAEMGDDERSPEQDVHHALNEPASDPDPTEWPDPYDKRPDPRDPAAEDEEMDFGDIHTPTGATSTSEPHHEEDPEVDPRKANPHEPTRRERRRAGH